MKKEFRCLLLLAMSVANSHFALADDAVKHSADVYACGSLAEQPVFSVYNERFNCALSAIIVNAQSSIKGIVL